MKLLPPVFVGFDAPLVAGTLLARRDRFVASVRLDNGAEVEAHCVNPGRMEGFTGDGARVWLHPQPKAGRRCPYTWEIIEQQWPDRSKGGVLFCSTNTVRPNLLVSHVLNARVLRGLDEWDTLEAEHTIKEENATTRLDFLLRTGPALHFVEVKNCHLVCDADGWGYFPDSVSERAVKHCDELATLASRGNLATVLIVVQRADVRHGVRPSDWHDPAFAAAARRAAAAGVRFRALRAEVSLEGTTITDELPVDLGEYDATPVAAQWERDRPSTGWVRGASGKRVANAPFAHHRQKASAAKQSKTQAKPPTSVGKKRRAGAMSASTPALPAEADDASAPKPAEPQTTQKRPPGAGRSPYF